MLTIIFRSGGSGPPPSTGTPERTFVAPPRGSVWSSPIRGSVWRLLFLIACLGIGAAL